MSKKRLMKNPHKVLPQILVTIVASWGYFCLGGIRGWSSPGIPSLNKTIHDPANTPNSSNYFQMSEEDLTWISSLPPLCAIFGSLMIIAPMQYLGRRRSLILVTIPGTVGFLLMAFTAFVRDKSILYVGRILTGLMGGATSPASQIYISECASPRVRGILGSFTASGLAFGIFVTYTIGAFVEWDVLCYILASFPVIMLIGMLFVPETPSWLLANDREEEARLSLQRLRGKRTDISLEFERLKMNQQKITLNGVQQSLKLSDLMKGSILKPFGIVMGIMFFQQFTGINAIIYNTVSIFESAGSSIEPNYATIICGAVQLVFTILSGSLVDRFGRRVLLLASGLVVSISMAAMGTFFYLQRMWGADEATAKLGWLPLVSLMLFFVAYSSGFANVPFIIMGEMFPLRYRYILGPTTSSFNLLCTFAVVRGFPSLQDLIGSDATFWMFMGFTVVSLFFIFFLLPETKGKTLEEIERLFSSKTKMDAVTKDHSAVSIEKVLGIENLDFRLDESNSVKNKVDALDSDSDDDDIDDNINVPAPL